MDVPDSFLNYALGILGVYRRLASGRQRGMDGLSPMSWADIRYFLELYELRLTTFELDLIRALDLNYVVAINRMNK